MKAYNEDFEKLHFTESNFGALDVGVDQIRIPVSGLFVLRGHPLLSQGDGPYAGWLVFGGVTSSNRTVTKYLGGSMAPGGYKEPYSREDGPFQGASNREQKEYAFEGLQQDPCAWVDNWVVTAASFQLLIGDVEA